MRDLPRLHEISLRIHPPRTRRSRAAASASPRSWSALAKCSIGARSRAVRSSSRNSACASPSRSSARPSSSSGRCCRCARTCCHRSGPRSSRACAPARRRCRSNRSCPVIERSLGTPHAEVFVDLEREPAGAASIAQVHRARLHDGRAVVLKVRRPGIEAKVEADLRLLAHLAQFVDNEVPEARRYQPVRVVEEFRRSTDARARSRRRGAQHRALRTQLPRRAARPDPAGLPAVDQRGDERAGAHRRHQRRGRGRAGARRARSQGCSQRAASTACSR